MFLQGPSGYISAKGDDDHADTQQLNMVIPRTTTMYGCSMLLRAKLFGQQFNRLMCANLTYSSDSLIEDSFSFQSNILINKKILFNFHQSFSLANTPTTISMESPPHLVTILKLSLFSKPELLLIYKTSFFLQCKIKLKLCKI